MGKRTGIRLVVMAVLLSLLGGLGMAAAQEGPTLTPALSPGERETEGGAPMLVSYQGQVLVDSTPYTGSGSFKFAVVNLAGDTSYWSNDGTSGGLELEPTASVALPVSNGLFNVLLGDTTLGGMTHALEASDFSGTDRALRVWFSSGSGFTLLSPDRRIAAAPYALQAQQAATASDADTLDGLHASQVVADSAWVLAGNAGTDPAAEFLGTTDAQPLVLRTNNAERLRVDAAGRLGVGTASPTERLTVSGNARVLNDDNPLARDTAAVAGTGYKDVAVAGHYAYVVSAGSDLLAIYDTSDPDNVLALGSTTTNLSGPWSVAVAGRYAYVASHNNSRLVIYDVSDPQNIAPKGYISTNLSYPDGLTVAGWYAYVVSDAGLAIFDASDPDNIVAKGTTNAGLSYPNSVSVVGRYAYVTSENNDTLAVFDVSDPSIIVAKGTTTANLDGPFSVAVAGRYAYVASFFNNTFAVFDVSNPSSITPAGATTVNVDTPRSVAVAGGPGSTYAYVACDHTKRLAVFDVTNPGAIVAKGWAATSDGPMSVVVAGRYAYVVQWNPVLAVFELNHLDAPAASIGSLHAGRLDVGESGIVGHDLDVLGSLSVGQGALFGGPLSASALSVLGSPVWHAGNDGAGSTLDADLLDGSHASAFSLSGHNHDGAYVNEGQADSVTSSMILNGTLAFADIGQNGCAIGQVMQWNGSAWACAAAGTTDHGALTGLGDDDHTQYFNLSQNEAVTGIPAFNGGTSGTSAPFSVDSNTLVTNLNADLLDGQHSAYFSPTTHTHATLTAGSGLSGGTYNGGAAATFAVVYGTAANTAVQGNQAATITAGNGLTGGVSADALGDGFTAALAVGGGNGITAAADGLNLGPFTANWSQTGAFDLVLDNAASELQIMESTGGAYRGTFDVGDLGANETYTFGTGGTVWTSGNDGTASTLDADLLDGQHSSYFSPTTHNHDAAYVNEGQASSVSSSMLQDGATLAEILDDDGTASTLDADLLDGQHAAYFSPTTHNHDTAYWMQNGNSFGAVGRLGTNDNYALELEVNNNRILRLEHDFDSPNLIGGDDVNTVTSGVHGAVIAGGGYTGAYPNKVQDHFGFVGGGYNNRAGDSSDGNVADDTNATVGGGINNVAGAGGSTVGGGAYNSATGVGAAIAGGAYNTASGQEAMIAGGMSNTAAGAYSFAAGRRAKANADGCFVWGDSTDADITCSTANQFVARASGGVSFSGSNVFTINGNTAWHSGNDGAGSGLDADAVDGAHGPFFAQGGNAFGATARLGTNDAFAIELEVNNTRALRIEANATSPNWIGGYSTNLLYPNVYGAVISGGGQSGGAQVVTDHYGVIGGGQNNRAGDASGDANSATYATVGGGSTNIAGAAYSTVPGGQQAVAGRYGEMAYASGAFSTPGDAQTSTYLLRNTSSGTTITTLYLDGSASQITLAADRSMAFDILITAMADNGHAACYQYAGGIRRDSTGQIGLIGPVKEVMAVENDTSWRVQVDTDQMANSLWITVQGALNRTIHWVATVRTVETTIP